MTLARVADRAKISRATVYRYFSDPGVLAAEATLDIATTPMKDLLSGVTDVRARVHKVARYYLDFSRENETQFRQFIARSMSVWTEGDGVKMRGARRIISFEKALEPVRERMSAADFEDLTLRLTMTTGMETHIVIEDVLKVDVETGDRLQEGLVDALLDRYLP